MALTAQLNTLARRSKLAAFGNALRFTPSWRCYSSAATTADGTLPLAGIRVLDMTRVLAGVGLLIHDFLVKVSLTYLLQSRTVRRSWAI